MLGRGKWIIIGVTLLAAINAFLLSVTKPKTFDASELLRVQSTASSTSSPNDIITANKSIASTYVTLFTNRGFLALAAKSLGGRFTLDYLDSHVSASVEGDTVLIRLRATGRTAAEATQTVRKVGAFAVSYVKDIDSAQNTAQIADLQRSVQALTAQIKRAGTPSAATSDDIAQLRQQRTFFNQQIATLRATGTTQQPSVQQASPASSSGLAISPRPVFDTTLGILFGLVVGIILAWIRDQLDRRVRNVREIEHIAERPVLATVPLVRNIDAAAGKLANAFDVLRVNLAIAGQRRPVRVLTVTSVREGEGKTSTTLGLGLSLARAGRRVLLVDGDLRRRGLSTAVGVHDQWGLTEVLSGTATLEEAIVPLDGGIEVLPAGRLHPSPPALLDSARFDEVLDEMRERYQVVLLDSPPSRHVADPVLMAAKCDALILVLRIGSVERPHLTEVVDLYRSASFNLLGEVVYDADTTESYGAYDLQPETPGRMSRLGNRDKTRRGTQERKAS
jgi:capsular exopolysaccharide synthesis family protein